MIPQTLHAKIEQYLFLAVKSGSKSCFATVVLVALLVVLILTIRHLAQVSLTCLGGSITNQGIW